MDTTSNIEDEVASLKKQLRQNNRILAVSLIGMLCLLLCAFDSTPQTMKLRGLRIVDDNGNDVIRIETVNGDPLIQMKTSSLATTITSGKIGLDSKDSDGTRSTSTIDFFNGSPRVLLSQQAGNQTVALGFEKARPSMVLSDRNLDQLSFVQSGSLVSQNASGSRKIDIQIGDEGGPAVRIADTENQADRLGVLTSDGVGSKVNGATTELRTVQGVQTMKLNTADGKNSISLTVDKTSADKKLTRGGQQVAWP